VTTDWKVHSQPYVSRSLDSRRLESRRRLKRGYLPRPVYWVGLILVALVATVVCLVRRRVL
jgi:hypothetical protein